MADWLAVAIFLLLAVSPLRTPCGERGNQNPFSMYRSFLSCAALAASLSGQAQGPVVHQVFALSEGYYDFFGGGGQLVPVTLGSYDPGSGNYVTVATIADSRFGSDVLVDEGIVFVAADDRVIRFDADTYQPLGEAMVAGVRKLAVWNDALLLTRGELGGLPHYFEARDKHTLALLWTIDPADGLTQSAEDVLVVGDRAYIAVSDAFNWSGLVGKVGIIDLVAHAYLNEVDLGPDGLNPERLFERAGSIFAFNNTDFSQSTISRVNAGAAALDYTVTVAANSGCAASALVEAEQKVYYLEYAQGELARFDVVAGTVSDTLAGSPAVYGIIEDPINGVLYATTTDFFSVGDLHVLSLDGQVQSTVPAGVSIGNLALDIRLSTGVVASAAQRPSVYPNPADQEILITLPHAADWVEVHDSTGRLALRQRLGSSLLSRVDINHLPPGLYTVKAEGMLAVRFTKH